MVLYHMYEERFYALVTWSKDNVVTFVVLESEYPFVQNKNHVWKEMYIVISG